VRDERSATPSSRSSRPPPSQASRKRFMRSSSKKSGLSSNRRRSRSREASLTHISPPRAEWGGVSHPGEDLRARCAALEAHCKDLEEWAERASDYIEFLQNHCDSDIDEAALEFNGLPDE
jgi:hypothetical protein